MGAGLLLVVAIAIDAAHTGALSGVLVAALAFLLLAAYEAVTPLGAAGQRAHTCASAATRLDEVCASQPLIADPPVPRALSGHGELCLRGVHLRYGPAEPWVLDGAELRLAEGEHVALLGDSGAGKSTLSELLVRLRDPNAGVVSLDGIDVRELAIDDLRAAVVLCGQDAHLFNTTIRENLLLARRTATDSEIAQVLAAVELDGWVADLPDGLDTIVGEAGAARLGRSAPANRPRPGTAVAVPVPDPRRAGRPPGRPDGRAGYSQCACVHAWARGLADRAFDGRHEELQSDPASARWRGRRCRLNGYARSPPGVCV